jgi:hypothetical protein
LKNQVFKKLSVTDATQYTLVKQDAVVRSDLVNTSVISNITIKIYQMSPVMSSNILEILIVNTKSLIKEIRKPNQLDAYEGIYIMQRKKQNVELMNGDEGNVRSRLFDVLF